MSRPGGYTTYWQTIARLATTGLRSLRASVASELPEGWHDVEIARAYWEGRDVSFVFRGRAGRTFTARLTHADTGLLNKIRDCIGRKGASAYNMVGGKCRIEIKKSSGPRAMRNASGDVVVLTPADEVLGIYPDLTVARREHGPAVAYDLELGTVLPIKE